MASLFAELEHLANGFQRVVGMIQCISRVDDIEVVVWKVQSQMLSVGFLRGDRDTDVCLTQQSSVLLCKRVSCRNINFAPRKGSSQHS